MMCGIQKYLLTSNKNGKHPWCLLVHVYISWEGGPHDCLCICWWAILRCTGLLLCFCFCLFKATLLWRRVIVVNVFSLCFYNQFPWHISLKYFDVPYNLLSLINTSPATSILNSKVNFHSLWPTRNSKRKGLILEVLIDKDQEGKPKWIGRRQ